MAIDAAFFAPFAAAAVSATATRVVARAWLGPVAQPAGWVVVKPGAMHWGGLVSGGGIVGLLVYIGLFVGSARSDAAFQMRVLWLLAAFFCVCMAGCLWQMRQLHRTAARFRGGQVSFCRSGDGTRITRNLADIAAMHRPWGGRARFVFTDGEELLLDPYADKVPELWNRIIDVNEP